MVANSFRHTANAPSWSPIQIHPKNPKIFEFRGQPRMLITATEHYGAVINRRFRFERYLEDAAEKGCTLTRLFTLFRELQTEVNPYSSCKPESPDFVAPFARTGPGTTLDGQLKYNLTRWNDEFFERLHEFLSLASDYGIIVEVVFLSNTYNDQVWALNPLHPQNNINDTPEIRYPEYLTQRHASLFDFQCKHIRKIVQETNRYDNIFYEICNESGGLVDMPDAPTLQEVDRWQCALVQVIQEAEKELPNRHLIAAQQTFAQTPFHQPSDLSFGDFPIDIVNIHPLPNTTFEETSYELGEFMNKKLKLQPLHDFALASYDQPKPLNYDEDNIAAQYKDFDG